METYILAIISPFFGAFFAFIFLRIADCLNEKHSKVVKNHKALCEVQLLINEMHRILRNNLTQIDEVSKGFKRQLETEVPIITSNRPGVFLTEFNKLSDIINESYVNDFITMIYQAKSLNRDIEGINELYLTFREALILKNLKPEIYKANFGNYKYQLDLIKKHLLEFKNVILKNLAICRILTRNSNPKWNKLNYFHEKKKYQKNFENIISKELNKLAEEV
ncbi:MAG: hypothetical protein APR54_12570 [Candidatus Cloacimonas sp. SDB]|nr:MAG: hypothetical protein APR54_12570 [Candidatus Cloacimonas sp. SDB]